MIVRRWRQFGAVLPHTDRATRQRTNA